jgi:nitrile hydratase accessory protein
VSTLTTAPDEPSPFAAPWQAQAFAMVVQLAETGVFSWPEWVAAFAAEPETDGRGYYERWLAAAEKLLVAKGLTSFDQLAARRFALGASGPTHGLR